MGGSQLDKIADIKSMGGGDCRVPVAPIVLLLVFVHLVLPRLIKLSDFYVLGIKSGIKLIKMASLDKYKGIKILR